MNEFSKELPEKGDGRDFMLKVGNRVLMEVAYELSMSDADKKQANAVLQLGPYG